MNNFKFLFFPFFFFLLLKLEAQPYIHNFSNSDSLISPTQKINFKTENHNLNWWFPGTGYLTGNFDASIGIHFWNDHFFFRNLQFRTQINLMDGLRMNNVIRSNREYKGISNFNPRMDEMNFEILGYRLNDYNTFSYSLRIGRMRYLRFPFPDHISIFDQVPGVRDLSDTTGTIKTSFDGALLVLDYQFSFGFGIHGSFIHWYQNLEKSFSLMESYISFKKNYKHLNFEIRTGLLHQRPEPPGSSSIGANAYLGIRWRGMKIGGLLEKLDKFPLYAGVLVSFSPSLITNILGTIHSDYTRGIKGLAFQIPLFHGNFGYVNEKNVEGEKIGEIVTERRMTFWQKSETRNFYEHHFSKNGITSGDSVISTIDEYSWYLKNESPVGPLFHLQNFNDVLNWDKKSARLGEIAQPVVYSFYKKGKVKYRNRFSIKPGIEFKNLSRKFIFSEKFSKFS